MPEADQENTAAGKGMETGQLNLWRIQGRGGGGGEGRRPVILRPNLKHFLETSPPTLSRGFDDLTPSPPPPRPLLSRQDNALFGVFYLVSKYLNWMTLEDKILVQFLKNVNQEPNMG